jgi:putative molybdopterin biosynthesis protein
LRRTRDAFARSGAQSLRARGLERLQRDEVTAVAVHFHSLDADGNLAAAASATVLRDAPDLRDALLVAFVRREQGLVLPPGNPKRLRGLSDVLALGARMAMRQQGTGAQMLLDVLLTRAGASTRDLRRIETPALTGPDLAEIVRAGQADCGIATRASARSAGLDFVPLVWENFDLAMRQRSYFRPAMQGLIRFLSERRLLQRAGELTGYDPSPAGQIRFAA